MIHAHHSLYCNHDTIIHRYNPFLKLTSLIVFAFTVAFLQNIYPAVIALSVIFFTIVLLPLQRKSFFIRVIKLSGFFVLLSVFLIFSDGTTVLYRIPLRILTIPLYKEGLILSLLIMIRGLAVFSIFYLLFATTRIEHVLHSFSRYYFPSNIIMIMYFTYHFILRYFDELSNMNKALVLRGYNGKKRRFYVRALLYGNLLVRCYDDTDRLFKAMLLRGFSGVKRNLFKFPVSFVDVCVFFMILLLSVTLCYVNIFVLPRSV